MRIISSWHTLINLAHAVGNAKKSGDAKRIKQAEKELKDYEEIVKMSDSMNLHVRKGDLL